MGYSWFLLKTTAAALTGTDIRPWIADQVRHGGRGLKAGFNQLQHIPLLKLEFLDFAGDGVPADAEFLRGFYAPPPGIDQRGLNQL